MLVHLLAFPFVLSISHNVSCISNVNKPINQAKLVSISHQISSVRQHSYQNRGKGALGKYICILVASCKNPQVLTIWAIHVSFVLNHISKLCTKPKARHMASWSHFQSSKIQHFSVPYQLRIGKKLTSFDVRVIFLQFYLCYMLKLNTKLYLSLLDWLQNLLTY